MVFSMIAISIMDLATTVIIRHNARKRLLNLYDFAIFYCLLVFNIQKER